MSQLPTQSQMSKVPNVSSYANVTSTTCFPKKDQAIILDSIEGITLREYLIALSSITPASTIRFISRISNARICIYLDSKKTADYLIEEKKNVTINKNLFEIKSLISRNKRIVLSNVCPVIPNKVIEEKFEEMKIKIMSPISFMKIGVSDPGFSHILSFRRQLYVSPDDESRLPESIQLSYEGTNYWIYISNDALKCFSCNTIGHLAKNCPQNRTVPQAAVSDIKESDNHFEEVIKQIFERNDDRILDPPNTPQTVQEPPSQPIPLNSKGKKRIHSPTTSELSVPDIQLRQYVKGHESDIIESETDGTESNVSMEDIVVKPKTKKKLKKDDMRTEEEVWKDIEHNMAEIDSDNLFPINLDQFISLLDNAKGKQNVKELTYTYTDNIKGLIIMCNKIHSKLNKSLKNRCSRLSKKLNEILITDAIVPTYKEN